MKKLIAAAFALTLLGAGAAEAAAVMRMDGHNMRHHRHQVCRIHHHHRVCSWR